VILLLMKINYAVCPQSANLDLKPHFAGIGENVYSTYLNDSFASDSGE